MRRFLAVAAICALAVPAWSAKKKKEEETQVLQVPRDLPAAVAGETGRLRFHVTPLSGKGLLSQQVRDALKALDRETGSDPVLRIRAFVAGSGDLRRVRDLVSETYTDRRRPLPALSLVRAGGLPLEGAQVVLEAVSAGKKVSNPNGLAFISAPVATSESPLDPVAPLAERSLTRMREAVRAAGLESSDVLRVTCFLSSLDNLAATRKLVEAEYGRAALNYVQTERAPNRALAACEAVARLRVNPGARLRALNPEGMPRQSGESSVALVGSPRVVLTGTQAAFGAQESDGRLALGRLQKALEQAGASISDVAWAGFYPLSGGVTAQVRKLRGDVFDTAQPPASTVVPFEGLPSMDSTFAVDAIAVKN